MKRFLYCFSVQGIALDEITESPFVILHDVKHDITLPLQIGASEASSLILAMECREKQEEESGYDLAVELFRKHRFALRGLEVRRNKGGHHKGTLVYKKGIRTFRTEVNPSTGIVLCAKLGAPIFFDKEAADAADYDNRVLIELAGGSAELLYLDPTHHPMQIM
ncbi:MULTISPECIES: bifunctional nuclease family protein [Sediminispirochaeta]|uniref:BFN domain-containing protein n=1 Tax=Sediminispirochaeta smaragdinae (strain DSM 11293 / JCM 15392 / SEBR 4228) TaxID=573413 RepID=E1R9F6_SEDSS|nr:MULTISPECIES: bifunctional nuclease domain-containing protein [Sediminispirochaeta]ADK83125.1 protein of unknown function DUF151 [Sediminispirochaeta smaragdinae DSM 11293]